MNAIKLTIAVLALSSAAALPGCGIGTASGNNAQEIRAATPVPVEITFPVRADIYATYDATTTISSDADAPVLARVAGEVVQLLVNEGDWAERGQVLAQLDGERLRLEMLAAAADLERVRKELQRYADLAERGLVSIAMFEGLKYDLDALQATYNLKKLNYSYSKIRAPISGIVSSRDVKLGQSIAAGYSAFRITDPDRLVAYLQIPQAELAKISAGQTASLQVDSTPDTLFVATIVRISPTVDARNGTFRATAVIDSYGGDLVPGMFARFTISYEKHENALTIPIEAIVVEDDVTAVYVVSDGKVVRRVVNIGISANKRVEILSGLNADEEIVVVGQSGLRDGTKVLASLRTTDGFTG